MKEHITERDGEYLLSPAATLALVAGAIHDPDSGQHGSERARRTIERVMAAARISKFEQLDILETLLATGAEGARLIPVFEALVQRVGTKEVVHIVQQGLTEARGDKE